MGTGLVASINRNTLYPSSLFISGGGVQRKNNMETILQNKFDEQNKIADFTYQENEYLKSQSEGWEVISFKNETKATSETPAIDFKVITAKDENGTEHTAIMFSNHTEFFKIKIGYKFNGWLRKIDAHRNWVDYKKPERNWNTKIGEVFISYK